jgi:hypothetical protein
LTRRYLTTREMADMLMKQHGLCAAEGCMSEGPFEADHSTPHAWDDKKPDQLLCVPCHRKKTKRDISNIAKTKRLRNQRTQYDKRKLAGGSRIKGRTLMQWRGLDGTIRSKGQ